MNKRVSKPLPGSILLRNACVATLGPAVVEDCDIRVSDGEIIAVDSTLKPMRGEETVDLSGYIVMPGFVNAHTHLYSSLSRGMPPPVTTPRNFVEILRKIWWRLDEALDEESIYFSALVGAIESLKFGTTTLVDHHASPNHIPNSLDLVKDGISRIGLRGLLCYETTDRGGRKRRDLGLEENERFLTENANNSHFRGTVGAHASLTLSDDSLGKLGELANIYNSGVHIHVAEDQADVRDCRKRHRVGIVDRLASFGLLSRKSVFAHGVHLSQKELSRVDRSKTWMVHNPRSNMNNQVGYAPLRWFGRHSALGTDGFPSDMFEESKIGYFRNVESDSRTEFHRLPAILQAGQQLISEFFGRPFGKIAKGSPADLIVLEYNPPTTIRRSNLAGHFLFGMNSTNVRHVMIDGKWIVWDKQVLGIDERSVMEKATKVASKLWKRMNG